MPDIIDRDTYRKIKKMSRDELQAFLVRYANNISGRRSIDLLDTDFMRSVKSSKLYFTPDTASNLWYGNK